MISVLQINHHHQHKYNYEHQNENESLICYAFKTPNLNKTAVVTVPTCTPFESFLQMIFEKAKLVDSEEIKETTTRTTTTSNYTHTGNTDFRKLAFIVYNGKVLDRQIYSLINSNTSNTNKCNLHHISIKPRLLGGIDRQNRVGSKFGGGGVSSTQQSERERKERLRQLALETVDLAKDPYLMRNHLGTYECKLCLTLHTNEGNYLAHTQGKKHQAGLAKRAAMEEKMKGRGSGDVGPVLPSSSALGSLAGKSSSIARVKIGRPGYEISKSRHYETNQRCLSFSLHFPEIDNDIQPRHRFMSAFEQRVESPPDRNYQYLLIAAEPYETIAFKVPNEKIDKSDGMFVTNWDVEQKIFTLTMYFLDSDVHVTK
jgi:splicing factor 3A subunit 2